MTTSGGDDELARLVGDLVTTLRQLEEEFEPRTDSGLPRPPSPRELVRLTSDVAIPAAILLLRTNIEALKLLQRALRMADGRPPTTGSSGTEVRKRAEQISVTTLSKLDGALADLQDAVEREPRNEDARELLSEARRIRSEVEQRLADSANGRDQSESAESGTPGIDGDDQDSDVPVDVDAELESLKNDVDDRDDGGDTDDTDSDESS